jgi:ACS family hexuronate transporter-like MFS transporter
MNAFQKTGEKMTNYRWTICAMLFFATTVNYLDRQVLSLTWDEFIKPEFYNKSADGQIEYEPADPLSQG